jgi:hypothetical protein
MSRGFIRPIPLDWAHRAMRLPGRTFHVAVAIWHQAGLRSSGHIRLSTKQLRECGIDRQVMYRALVALESAGLVKVERRPGLQPRVTIIDESS